MVSTGCQLAHQWEYFTVTDNIRVFMGAGVLIGGANFKMVAVGKKKVEVIERHEL